MRALFLKRSRNKRRLRQQNQRLRRQNKRLVVLESSLAEYIAHSARNLFPDFERPLLAPQPTDLDDKKRGLFQMSCSIFSCHQNVNPITFSKRLCKQKGVCGPLSNRLRSTEGPFAAAEEPFAAAEGPFSNVRPAI